jgi:hypothetical protein
MRRLLPCSVLLLSACYSYATVQPTALRAGMSVRVRVSAAAAEAIAPLLGATDARVLVGTLVDATPTGLVVEVPTLVRADIGSSVQTLHQRVSIARADLLELESRQLDKTRTAVFVGGAVVIVGSTVIKALRGEPGKEAPPTGGTTDARIPVP